MRTGFLRTTILRPAAGRTLFFLSLLLFIHAGFSQNPAPPPAWPALEEKLPEKEALPTPTTVRSPIDELERKLSEAIRSFDDKNLAALADEMVNGIGRNESDYRSQILTARCFLARCDLRRFMRKTFELEKKRDKELRSEDAVLAETGIPFAERAVQLMPESAEAYRVLGELYIHQITGPIAGFRYGPKGKQNIEKALEIDPKDPEANRAIGLMYLYNPPINGGNRELAATTFDKAARLGGDDRCRVLGARAYRELGQKDKAVFRLKEALKINPKNLEARLLLEQIEKEN